MSSARISRPGAVTVSRRQAFTSWRTLPGQSKVTSAALRRRRQQLRLDAQLPRGHAQVVAQQFGYVLAPLAQRRNLDANHVEPVQQVLAEMPGLHARLEILVGRRDHPHVDLDRRLAADPVELAFGQHAQQPRLQRGRHVADLVEKQRAAIGLLEAAAAQRIGAGERALLVAEQLGLEQVRGERRGVERDERPCWSAGCGGAARAPPAPCRCPIRR